MGRVCVMDGIEERFKFWLGNLRDREGNFKMNITGII